MSRQVQALLYRLGNIALQNLRANKIPCSVLTWTVGEVKTVETTDVMVMMEDNAKLV